MREKGRMTASHNNQLLFNFDRKSHSAQRDLALERFEHHRAELVQIAHNIARRISTEQGQVTATDVLLEMRAKYPTQLDQVDPRFLGAVFRRPGWEPMGYAPTGSHCRPVRIWRYLTR